MFQPFESYSLECSRELLKETNTLLPLSNADGILDLGCGTGANIAVLLSDYADDMSNQRFPRIIAADSSPGMIEQLRETQHQKETSNPLWKAIELHVWDATKMDQLDDETMTHVLSSVALFLMPKQALNEAVRVLKPGGVLAMTSTARPEPMWNEFLSTISMIRPDKKLSERSQTWRTVDEVVESLTAAGLRDCKAYKSTHYVSYGDAEEFVRWTMDLPMAKKLMIDLISAEKEDWVRKSVKYLQVHCSNGWIPETSIFAVGRKE